MQAQPGMPSAAAGVPPIPDTRSALLAAAAAGSSSAPMAALSGAVRSVLQPACKSCPSVACLCGQLLQTLTSCSCN